MEVINTRFTHPARIVVCGPSSSGKTSQITEILVRAQDFFYHQVTKVVCWYAAEQPGYARLKKNRNRLHTNHSKMLFRRAVCKQ